MKHPRKRTLSCVVLGAVLSYGCSTVDRDGRDSNKNTVKGQRDCMIFPGAQAWDPKTETWKSLELVEFPEYCWCEVDDNVITAELLDQLEQNALAECIWTALHLGYDPGQTTCVHVMVGPVEGGFDGDTSCTLYGGEDYSVIGGGETGGEAHPPPPQPYFSTHRQEWRR